MEVRGQRRENRVARARRTGPQPAIEFKRLENIVWPWRCRETGGPALKGIFCLTGGSLLMEGGCRQDCLDSAGINRHGVANERVVQGRCSEPPWPRAM